MRNELSQNLVEKIVALLLAIGLWAYVQGREPASRSFELSLRTVNMPPDLVVTQGTDKVRIDVSGQGSDLRRVQPGRLDPYVDLSRAHAGTMRLPVMYTLPADIDLSVRITPATVTFSFDRLVREAFTVTAHPRGDVAPGFKLARIEFDPSRVEVVGPRGAVDQVMEVAAPVDVSTGIPGAQPPARVTALDRRAKQVENVTVSPTEVRPQLVVEEVVIGKEVPVTANVTGEPDPSVTLQKIVVTPPRLRLQGRADRIRALQTIPTAEIPVAGLKKNKTVDALVVLPDQVTSIDGDTVKVSITVAPKPATTPVPSAANHQEGRPPVTGGDANAP